MRTSALSSLHAFLSARQVAAALTPLEVLKLWKGLFYALWMCDRAVPQQNLCADLAALIWVLPRPAVVPWLRGFWATMAREWTGIDVLRMEKFLLLVRRVLGAAFRWMRKDAGGGEQGPGSGRNNTAAEKEEEEEEEAAGGCWDADKVDGVLGLLAEWPFALEDEARIERATEKGEELRQTIPAGMRLHVLDIWVDEAEKVGLLDESDEEAGRIVQRIIDQIDALEQATTRPAVRIRSKESLADDRLPANRGIAGGPGKGMEGSEGPGDDDGSWDGFDD